MGIERTRFRFHVLPLSLAAFLVFFARCFLKVRPYHNELEEANSNSNFRIFQNINLSDFSCLNRNKILKVDYFKFWAQLNFMGHNKNIRKVIKRKLYGDVIAD